jgi:hypothetical protein
LIFQIKEGRDSAAVLSRVRALDSSPLFSYLLCWRQRRGEEAWECFPAS